MNLVDRLHCPRCKGRLTAIGATIANGFPGESLCCTSCDWAGPVAGGIADLLDQQAPAAVAYGFDAPGRMEDPAADTLINRIRDAAGDRWPVSLGEVLELGCGSGPMTAGLVPGLNGAVQGLIATDSDLDRLRACRARLVAAGLPAGAPALFARIGGQDDPIRDAVADTVAGATVLSAIDDVRTFLAMVHRVLRPGGRAFFILPNRRYHQALCHTIADVLVQMYARQGQWPAQADGVMHLLSDLRLRLVHQGDSAFLSQLSDKHLLDSDALEDLAKQIGFAGVDVIPLDPDPLGGEACRRLCQQAGIADDFAGELAALAMPAGARYFSLLSRQESSAFMLLWVTKGIGHTLRTFSAPPPPVRVPLGQPELALGGVPPRWSIELLARDSAAGIEVSLGGWALVNVDVVWVRVKLDGAARDAPVWRARPDVHEVLNGRGLYTALNTLCSGVEANLLFDGLHPRDGQCQLEVEIVLANGVVAKSPSPVALIMEQTLVVSH
jgi:ubiquinone/menaquinone biosynthesis C-methylase UbiE/uncharacterized protein YbaR (Trm112 family)